MSTRGLLVLTEPRRRAYLDAMQVVQWVPRAELPFAAASRPALLETLEVSELHGVSVPAPAPAMVAPVPAIAPRIERLKRDIPRPATAKPQPKAEAEPAPQPAKPVAVAPRFALQLLRAGTCLVLAELPTGDAFQSRDPGYLLLKDMLRAAGLPEAPQLIGEPVRWPWLAKGSLDQGPEAARDFVQGFVAAQLEVAPCACLWLVGLPALRFAANVDETAFYQEVAIDGLCEGWALPGLETLMDEPMRKADIWQAMRRLMPRWSPAQ